MADIRDCQCEVEQLQHRGRTFHRELVESDMRIALPAELPGQEYVFECAVCHHATLLMSAGFIPSECGGCRLILGTAGGRFWVLLPKEPPVRPHLADKFTSTSKSP